ncbi:MAG: hypothetical protein JZU49_06100 [Sulfuricurvum sp.]|nr:hypothetical protein [Sulfuricurvum sp.]
MQKYFILWVSAFALLVGGCATKHYSISTPKMIVIKSPKLKYADMGYLRYEGDAVEMELFTAGVAVEKISIDKQVCVSAGCMSEEAFVSEYLYKDYPRDTMRRVLQGEPIFDGNGTSESCGGVKIQNIRNDEMDIVYRRSSSETFFKDRLNGLMIKISEIRDSNETK